MPFGVKIKEREKIDKYLKLARQQKMLWEGDIDTNCSWYTWNYLQKLGKKIGGTKNQKGTVIPIVVGTLGIISKSLEKRLKELKFRRGQ